MPTQESSSFEKDERFYRRIQSGIQTVLQWESDTSLLKEIRSSLPLSLLSQNPNSTTHNSSSLPFFSLSSELQKYTRKSDSKTLNSPDHLLLQRLTFYFKSNVMTWVNNPPCNFCQSKETKNIGQRSCVTPYEVSGGASRVELYSCSLCGSETTFPRFNLPRTLNETRKGRCGEFANLFGVYCRAVGFEVRYILDFTDHVWVEVYLPSEGRYVMADSCEGQIDVPQMYEKGWGKKLNYMLGFSVLESNHVEVTDVTRRYTRAFYSEQFQARRKECCSSESESVRMIENHNQKWKGVLGKSKRQDMLKRNQMEERELKWTETETAWVEEGESVSGRLSGSLAWRRARGEMGNEGGSVNCHNQSNSIFHVENILPTLGLEGGLSIDIFSPSSQCIKNNFILLPFHSAISISGVDVAVGQEGMNVVILDERSGCILQSRFFDKRITVCEFLNAIPDGRIVVMAIVGETFDFELEHGIWNDRIGGFPKSEFSAFVGQVGSWPHWTASIGICSKEEKCSFGLLGEAHVSISLPSSGLDIEGVNLRCEPRTVPSTIYGRIPDSIQPLAQQTQSTIEQKQSTFWNFFKQNPFAKQKVVGFVSKEGEAIYLLSNRSFPLKRTERDWTTFHILPNELVTETPQPYTPKTPTNTDHFTTLLSPQLAQRAGLPALSTPMLLENKKLIGLYFSAHWCPPCRQFTPMLAEFYSTLKDVGRNNDLEIVFVSSDRDNESFDRYFGTMPWLALPFAEQTVKQMLSTKFGIRGIPAFLILDGISGEVVTMQARNEVINGCRMGDRGVEQVVDTWLKAIPEESQMLLESIALSCEETTSATKENAVLNSFLVRQTSGNDKTDTIPLSPGSGSLNDAPSTSTLCLDPFVISVPTKEEDIVSFNDGAWNTSCLPLCSAKICHKNDSTLEVLGIQSICHDSTDTGFSEHMNLFPATQKDQSDQHCWTDLKMLGDGNDIVKVEGITSPSVGFKALTLCRDNSCVEEENKKNLQDRIKEIFSELVSAGKSPNVAAAEAIKLVTEDANSQTDSSFSLKVPAGYRVLGFHGTLSRTRIISLGLVVCCQNKRKKVSQQLKENGQPDQLSYAVRKSLEDLLRWNTNDEHLAKQVLLTANKYLTNALKDPSKSKFRSFKIKNKFLDAIYSCLGGVELLHSLGFDSYDTEESGFMMSIPLGSDLEEMEQRMKFMLKELN